MGGMINIRGDDRMKKYIRWGAIAITVIATFFMKSKKAN